MITEMIRRERGQIGIKDVQRERNGMIINWPKEEARGKVKRDERIKTKHKRMCQTENRGDDNKLREEGVEQRSLEEKRRERGREVIEETL